MTRLTAASLLTAAVLLGACSRVTSENFERIESGMNKDEVYAILGKPTEVSGGGIGSFTMSVESWIAGDRRITLTFRGDTMAIKTMGKVESGGD
ncbi:MAG: hypothetical protein ACPGZP_09435 [Panacagrimonas sp.]